MWYCDINKARRLINLVTVMMRLGLVVLFAVLFSSGCGVIDNLAYLDSNQLPSSRKGDADVVFVRAVLNGNDNWTFHVTVAHNDIGWEDYADGWDVILPDGTVLKADGNSPYTRLLLHPHETEQPFTRSQSGIIIEPDVAFVTVRAHDLVDGYGGREVVVELRSASGPDFEVVRDE